MGRNTSPLKAKAGERYFPFLLSALHFSDCVYMANMISFRTIDVVNFHFMIGETSLR